MIWESQLAKGKKTTILEISCLSCRPKTSGALVSTQLISICGICLLCSIDMDYCALALEGKKRDILRFLTRIFSLCFPAEDIGEPR